MATVKKTREQLVEMRKRLEETIQSFSNLNRSFEAVEINPVLSKATILYFEEKFQRDINTKFFELKELLETEIKIYTTDPCHDNENACLFKLKTALLESKIGYPEGTYFKEMEEILNKLEEEFKVNPTVNILEHSLFLTRFDKLYQAQVLELVTSKITKL